MNSFDIETMEEVDDGIGGFTNKWTNYLTVGGFLDMLTGSDISAMQNAIVEESSHVLIIPEYVGGIDNTMRVVDDFGRLYDITYVDDPVGMHHHIELYLVLGGAADGIRS